MHIATALDIADNTIVVQFLVETLKCLGAGAGNPRDAAAGVHAAQITGPWVGILALPDLAGFSLELCLKALVKKFALPIISVVGLNLL